MIKITYSITQKMLIHKCQIVVASINKGLLVNKHP